MRCEYCHKFVHFGDYPIYIDGYIKFKNPGGLTGTCCTNPFCLGSVRFDMIENKYIRPFPDKRERKRFMAERENASNGN